MDNETIDKSLKKGKARDPLNLVNEIFRPEVAGLDLLLSLLKIVNMVKKQQMFPTKLRFADIDQYIKVKTQKQIWKTRGDCSILSLLEAL